MRARDGRERLPFTLCGGALLALVAGCGQGAGSPVGSSEMGPHPKHDALVRRADANVPVATISGTFAGRTFSPKDCIAADFSSSSSSGLAIIVTDYASACASFQANTLYRDSQIFELALYANTMSGFKTPTSPGTFSVLSTSAMTYPPLFAYVVYVFEGATCMTPASYGNSGTVTLTALTPSHASGTFDVTMQSGDHVTGTFDGATCLVAPPDGGTSSPTCK